MLNRFPATIGGERREKRRTWGGRGRFRCVMSCRRKFGKSRWATPGSFARAGAPGGVFLVLVATPPRRVCVAHRHHHRSSLLRRSSLPCFVAVLRSCLVPAVVRSLSRRNTYAMLYATAAVACNAKSSAERVCRTSTTAPSVHSKSNTSSGYVQHPLS